MVAITPALRIAIYTVWPQKCVWGHEPITFKEMEVDHLIPKSLTGDDLHQALEMHGLPPGFDLTSEENLAPACGPCNGSKTSKIPPEAPGITLLLEQAAGRADKVRETVKGTAKKGKVEKLLGQLLALDASDETIHDALTEGVQELGELIAAASPSLHSLKLTSTEAIKLGSDGQWAMFTHGGFRDCPNENCITGDINWASYPDGDGSVDCGACDSCGTIAVRCPDCGCENGAFSDDVLCTGCGNKFNLIRDWDSGDVTDLVVVRSVA